MAKRCIYCKIDLPDSGLIDFCDSCGTKAFGSKLFKTIVENVEKAEKRGDLFQG